MGIDQFMFAAMSRDSIDGKRPLGRVMISMMRDETQLFKQWSDNDGFNSWLADDVFHQPYRKGA